MFNSMSRQGLISTAGALLVGACGFLLGQQVAGGGSSPTETLPKPIVTHDSRVPIPNMRWTPAFPELSTEANRRTRRRAS
jgi:hypothetical protein